MENKDTIKLQEVTQKDFELIKQYKDLRGLDFSNSYFKGVKFDSEIEKCNFTNSKFYNCEFTENIQECNFTNCDMDAEFRLGNVENCNFTNARIEGSAYQEKFLVNDFTEAKVQRFRMFGQSEFSKNELQGTTFDAAFFGEKVSVTENHFLNSVKVELSNLPDSLQEYSQQQMKVLNGEKNAYGEKLTSLSNTMAEQRANRYLNEFAEMHKENIANANLEGMKKTVVINAFAGAGAGKTTACHMIAAELKKRGYVAEYVSEYAKDLVWDKKYAMLDGKERNQFEILKEQLHRMDNKIGKVDFIVTDAPVLLNQIYNQELTDYYKEMLISINTDYSNFNFFINRNPEEFQQEDRKIKELLSEYNLEYQEYTHETLENLVDKILEGQDSMKITGKDRNRRCYEIDDRWKSGDVVGEELYNFLAETYDTREMTENYFQLADEVREINPVTGKLNGENEIHPFNPDTQKAEPVYRTFMEKNGEYIYVGHCFAGNQMEYGEKFGESKGEINMEETKNARVVAVETSEDFADPGIGFESKDLPNGKREVMYRLITINELGGIAVIPQKDFYFEHDADLYRYLSQHNSELYLVSHYDLEHLAEEKEFGIDIEERIEKEDFSLKQCSYEQLSDIEKRIKYMDTHEIEKHPRNEVFKFDEKIYDENQKRVLFEAQKDFLTEEQFSLLANPELNSFQMQELRLAFFEELTVEQISMFATKNVEHWKINLAIRGIKEGITSEKVMEILNNENAHNWLAGNDLIENEIEKVRNGSSMGEIKTMEGLDKSVKESGKERSSRDLNITWEHIEEQWDYIEKHVAEYTPEAYEEAKMEIEAQEMFLEEQEQVFIESIEDVKVSERIEEKPIGTVEVKGEIVEFFSENEGLEKYIDASFKLSVSELESLKSFENEQWKITLNEPDKHLLLQYKAEKYFKGAENVRDYTLEDFCKDHEGKIKIRDVVKETGERLTEFGDSALKIEGESENKVITDRDTRPEPSRLTEQQVHDILEIIKGSASNHKEFRELQEISRYISSMEQQLKEVSQQLDFVKDKLTSLQSKNPEVDKLINDTDVLKKHTFSLQEKLQEIKQDFTEMIKNVSESIKQTGQSGLNKLMERFKIEERLENFQDGLSKLTADVNEKQIKMERIGYELGQAGAHLQNVDKVANGKVALEPSKNAGLALGDNLAAPFRKIKDTLNGLNRQTGKVLEKVKNLKKKAAENRQKKETKREEKSKKKEQKKERRKKAIQKRRMMNMER